jgi:hypothetical protein
MRRTWNAFTAQQSGIDGEILQYFSTLGIKEPALREFFISGFFS